MSPVFPPRRRAEEFDTLITQGSTPPDPRAQELVELVGAMRSMDEPGVRPEPRPEFVNELRSNLMAAAVAELAPVQTSARVADQLTVGTRSRTEKRLTAALAGIAMVGASATMAVASQGALPGDALYPIKRALEDASAGVSLNDAQKGSRLLDSATDRLHELDRLVAEGDADPATLESTLATFRSQSDEGAGLLLDDFRSDGSTASAEQVLAFTATGVDRLAELDGEAPPETRPAITDSAELLFRLDAAARQLCVLCAGGISEFPAELIPVAAEDDDVTPGLTVVPEDEQTVVAAPTDLPSISGLPERLPGSVTSPDPSVPPAPGSDAEGSQLQPPDPTSSVDPDGDGAAPQVKNPLPGPSLPVSGATSTVGDVVDGVVDGTTDELDNVLPGTGTAVQETVDQVEDLLCTATKLVCLNSDSSSQDGKGSDGLLGQLDD